MSTDSNNTPDLDEYSVRLLRAVQHYHGKTKGAEVLHALTDILGKDWSGRVVYHLIADTHTGAPRTIYIDSTHCDKKINAIKSLRWIDRNLGLKEAKDIIEGATSPHGTGPYKLEITIDPSLTPEEHDRKIRQEIVALREAGCKITEIG